jgi:hypothetical protein
VIRSAKFARPFGSSRAAVGGLAPVPTTVLKIRHMLESTEDPRRFVACIAKYDRGPCITRPTVPLYAEFPR